MNATIGLARHGKRTTRMSPQEIFKYRLQNPATSTPPVTTQPHNLDIRGNAKPTGRVYINSKTIWFTLYRIARPGHVSEGQWIPITRTMAVTPSRRKIVNRLCKAQAEAREQLAAEMLQAGRAQQERTVKCPVCGKWARQEGERYYHLEVKSLATGERVGDKQLFCQAERISPIPDHKRINAAADLDIALIRAMEMEVAA